MKIVTAPEVEQIFSKWKAPFRFEAGEFAEIPHTIDIVNRSAPILAFPTPAANDGINLLNLRQLLGIDPSHPPSIFDHPWYMSERFMEENCAPGWHFVQTDVAEGSLEQPFNYYNSLLSHNLTLPTAVEVVLMLFLHFELTGERLLWKRHTWCSNSATLGRFVTVGAFGRNGVFISSHPPQFASRALGICGKLKI